MTNKQSIDLDEQGVALVLFAIMMPMFIVFLALAIDTHRMSTSHTQKRSTTELAALAALERYQSEAIDPLLSDLQNHQNRLAAAIERAEEIAGLSENALMGGRSGDLQADASAAGNEIQDSTGTASGYGSDVAGVITPGRYFAEEPDGLGGCASYSGPSSATCPCPGNSWDIPCFLPDDGTFLEVQAFELTLHSKVGSPIRNVFGRLFDNESTSLSTTARATLVPRHGLFAVDLSRSTYWDTHLNILGLPLANWDRASEYIYRLDTGAGSGCGAGNANPCIANGSGCSFVGGALVQALWYGGLINGLTLPGLLPNRPAALQPRWRHYRDDYRCYSVDTDDDGTPDADYLVDTARHSFDNDGDTIADGFYRGPEPLSSILNGIHEAILVIEDRSVSGDWVAVMGFDQEVLASRQLGPTRPGETEFEDIKDITEVNNPSAAQLAKRLNAFFFPRFPDSQTDIPEALMTGADTLKDIASAELADNFMVMFSDGLSTCRHNGTDNWGLTIDDDDEFLDQSGPDSWVLRTENCLTPPDLPGVIEADTAWALHITSLQEGAHIVAGERDDDDDWERLKDFPSFVDRQITFHAVTIGDGVQPHNILRMSDRAGECMDDYSARRLNANFVMDYDDDDDDNKECYASVGTANSCPYVIHQWEIYDKMVKPTGGYWVPVRRPCDPSNFPVAWGIDQTACEAGDLVSHMNSVCASSGEPPGDTIQDPELETALIIDRTEVFWMTTSRSRVACDVECRSQGEQISDFVTKLYEENPYVLVE